MAGAMRKMGIYLGLVEDEHAENGEYEGEYSDDSEYGDYEPEPAPARREVAPPRSSASSALGSSTIGSSTIGSSTIGSSTSSWSDHAEPVSSPRASVPSSSQVLATERPSYTARSYSSSRSSGLDTTVEPEVSTERSSLARIITLHPRTYNEARVIGEQFRDGVPVIMNLTEMDDSDAKRLVDFAAGLTFGLRGSIDRVTNRVFLLSPQNVNVTAEDKARLAEGGFFNQS